MMMVIFSSPCSPAEELSFGSRDSEKKSLVILSNVTKNQVAFKVSGDDASCHMGIGCVPMCVCVCSK